MKKIISAFLFILTAASLAQQKKSAAKTSNLYDWDSSVDVLHRPAEFPNAKKLPLIKVAKNKFVNANGDTILFRGVSIADPDNLEQRGYWNKNLFIKVKEMGATVVRIPIHPVPWRMRTPAKYLALLDSAVTWSTELGIYVMIDWHSIGNLSMELFQDPMYNTTKKETYEFWRLIAAHFKGHNTPAFYEIFNEPATWDGKLGQCKWSDWKKINEDIIHLIRAYDEEKIPLVAGLDWAYDLTPLHNEPVEAEGIGYVVHPYAHKRQKPWEMKWEESFGFAAEKYPVVATEFGFVIGKGQWGAEENFDYGNAIINFLEEKKISWVCWIFDPLWTPNLLQSWEKFRLSESGEFFKKAMQGKRESE